MSPDEPRSPDDTGADEPTTQTPAASGPGNQATGTAGSVRPTTIAPGASLPTWLDEPPVSAEETQARDKEAKAAKKAEKKAARAERRAERKKRPLLRRIHPVLYVLAAGVVLLAAYYAVVLASGAPKTSTDVPTTSNLGDNGSIRVDVRVDQIDTSRQTMQLFLQPVPLNDSVRSSGGELAEDLRIEVRGSGLAPASFTFPANSTIDEVSTRVALDSGPESYPFDKPTTDFRLLVANDQSGEAIPARARVTNTTGTFDMKADVAAVRGEDIAINLRAERDTLTIALVVLQLATIVLATIIALVVILIAIARRTVELSVVIWLGATLIAIPALRNAMPDAPPIGTRIDYLVLFPCIAIIAAALALAALMLVLPRKPRSADAPDTAEPTTTATTDGKTPGTAATVGAGTTDSTPATGSP